jgi:hypothetical protein
MVTVRSSEMPMPTLPMKVETLVTAIVSFSGDLRLALGYIPTDPASSLTKSRMVMEKLLRSVFQIEMGCEPRKPLLGDMLADNQFTRKIERRVLARINSIRDMGNLGPHGEPVEPSDAARVLDDLCAVLDWYLTRYPNSLPPRPSEDRSPDEQGPVPLPAPFQTAPQEMADHDGLRKSAKPAGERTTNRDPLPKRRWQRRWLVMGPVTCMFVLVTIWLIFQSAGLYPRSGGQPESGRGKLQATLTLRVWKKGNTTVSLSPEEPGVLPLQPGDLVRAEVRVNRPAFLYLLYLDSTGSASPLFPWRKYDWADLPPESPTDSVNLPEDPTKDAAPLTPSPPGIEALILLARETALTPAEHGALVTRFRGKVVQQQDRLSLLKGVVLLSATGAEQFTVVEDRGRPELAESLRVEDPVEQIRRLLRAQLKDGFDDAGAVCYPFDGR